MGTLLDAAALVVDCSDSVALASFYKVACGGEVSLNAGSTTLQISGLTVIFREIADYRKPQWPGSGAPMHGHFDFFTDDLPAAELTLCELGATTAEYQAHRDDGLIVMLDPAGHPFCVGTRL